MLMGFAILRVIGWRWPVGSLKAVDCRIRENLLTRMIVANNEHGLAPATTGAAAI